MLSLRIEVSVRVAKAAHDALQDTGLASSFDQIASNVWQQPEYDEDESGEYPGDEYVKEQLEELAQEVADTFVRYGVNTSEVEILVVEVE